MFLKQPLTALSMIALLVGVASAGEDERTNEERRSHGQPVQPPTQIPEEVRARAQQALHDQVSPLSAEEIRQLRDTLDGVQRVTNERYEHAEPRITTETIHNSPGSEIPIIYAGVGFNTSVLFQDAAGNPWRIRNASIGNNDAFELHEMDPHAVRIEVKQANTFTNISVLLEGQSTPLVFRIRPPSEHLDFVKTYAVNGLSPALQAESAASTSGGFTQPQRETSLNQFLNGQIPSEALPVSILSGPDVDMWSYEGRLIVRTQMQLTVPSADFQPLHGSNGWRVYSISRPNSVMTFLDGGSVQYVSISESVVASIRG